MQKVSVVITVLNEEDSIQKLLISIINQTKRAQEIVVVDGGSQDRTVQLIKEVQKKDKTIRLIEKKSSRSQGRNIGVEASTSEIIAMTDADCSAEKDWLKKITEPFKDPSVDIVAGFYKMLIKTSFQKALSKFLGVTERNYNQDFLPSTRSIAFRKSIWKKLRGFPGGDINTGEDTLFNLLAIQQKANFAKAREAIVLWQIPNSLQDTMNKFFNYAKWDARTNSLWHPVQKFKSHNLKVISIYLRYLLFFILLINLYFRAILLIVLMFYSVWAFYKTSIEVSHKSDDKQFNPTEVGFWGIVIQFSSDLAIMAGAFQGFLQRFTTKL